jgi:hypothetical protein
MAAQLNRYSTLAAFLATPQCQTRWTTERLRLEPFHETVPGHARLFNWCKIALHGNVTCVCSCYSKSRVGLMTFTFHSVCFRCPAVWALQLVIFCLKPQCKVHINVYMFPNWQKESWQTFEETSGCVRPERANKWPNSMIDRWWWWWWCS